MSIELDPAELGFERKAKPSLQIFWGGLPGQEKAVEENSPTAADVSLGSGPFNHEVVRTLRIRNNNYDPVAFKVSCFSKCAMSRGCR